MKTTAEQIKPIADLLIMYGHNFRQAHNYLDELIGTNDDPDEIEKLKREVKLWSIAIKKTSDIICHLVEKVYTKEVV